MILMNNFMAEPKELKKEMMHACRRVIDSGFYILGNELQEFESKWSAACGVKYGIGVGNGMDAIELSLRVLDIGPGDEVITTGMTAVATVLAIVRAGATPVLADIETEDALMSIESVSRCFTEKTKAIVLVHLYGRIDRMDQWTKLCKSKNIHLIEDCAQAHLSMYKNKYAGSFGTLGAFSFYPTKNLGTLGDAGAIISDCKQTADKLCALRNYGQAERYHHPYIGMNSRLDEIQSAMLIQRLKWLNIFTKKRQEIAQFYNSKIKNTEIKKLSVPSFISEHVYHLFVLRCNTRDELRDYLTQHGIQTHIHYPIPVHKQTPFINILRDPMGLENTEVHAKECISIPCNPQMTKQQLLFVTKAINLYKQ